MINSRLSADRFFEMEIGKILNSHDKEKHYLAQQIKISIGINCENPDFTVVHKILELEMTKENFYETVVDNFFALTREDNPIYVEKFLQFLLDPHYSHYTFAYKIIRAVFERGDDAAFNAVMSNIFKIGAVVSPHVYDALFDSLRILSLFVANQTIENENVREKSVKALDAICKELSRVNYNRIKAPLADELANNFLDIMLILALQVNHQKAILLALSLMPGFLRNQIYQNSRQYFVPETLLAAKAIQVIMQHHDTNFLQAIKMKKAMQELHFSEKAAVNLYSNKKVHHFSLLTTFFRTRPQVNSYKRSAFELVFREATKQFIEPAESQELLKNATKLITPTPTNRQAR